MARSKGSAGRTVLPGETDTGEDSIPSIPEDEALAIATRVAQEREELLRRLAE